MWCLIVLIPDLCLLSYFKPCDCKKLYVCSYYFLDHPRIYSGQVRNLRLQVFVFDTLYDLYLFLFNLTHYVPSTIFQLNRDGSSWVEPVLS